LSGTQFGNGTLVLLLSPPVDTGGLTLEGYTCRQTIAPVDPLTSPSATVMSFDAAGPFVVAGLTNGVNYSYVCSARNAFGSGNYSTPPVFGMPARVPDPPVNLVALPGPGRGELSVTWSPPAWDGGVGLQSFVLSWTQLTTGLTRNMTIPAVAGATSYAQALTGLTWNSTYLPRCNP